MYGVAMPDETAATIKKLLERVELLEAELAATKAELARKDQIILGLQQRLFGRSSERFNPNQLEFDFGDALLGKPEELPENEDGSEDPPDEKPKPKRTRRRKADLFPRNLPVIISRTEVPDEVAANPDAYIEIGEEYHDELEVVRSSMYWDRQVRKKYILKSDRTAPPVMPPAPQPSVPGTLCGPSLMAQILVDKYEDHLPHYRQSKRFRRRFGMDLSRQTVNGWTHAAADHLSPIGDAIRNELVHAKILQVDESPADYLDPGHGKTKEGYLWYYRDVERRILYCDWQLGRGHESVLDILGYDEETNTILFSGMIQCDGFSAYQALAKRFEEIRLAGCLAHIRRKFYEALEQAPKVVLPILEQIGELYRIERWLRTSKAPPDCRWVIRQATSSPIVKSLYQEILTERKNHLPQSKLGAGITYALNQWQEFVRYLEDGSMEIDNNLIENAIRPAKLGLKNYLFFGNAEAGKTSALIYTLLGNCREQGIDPELYLEEAIRRLPADASVDQAASLTPAALAEEIRAMQPVPAGASRDAAAA